MDLPEGESEVSESHLPPNDPDRSLSFDRDASQVSEAQSSDDIEGTPRASTATGKRSAHQPWANDASLLDNLEPKPSTRAGQDASRDPHQRLRLGDLPPDSPDIPVPEWETLNHTKARTLAGYVDPSPAHSSANSSLPLPFPTSTRIMSSNPALLHKILTKTFASSPRKGATAAASAPGSSTPGRGGAGQRSGIPRDWNGLADLSQTPLSAFASPIKRPTTGADESGWGTALGGGVAASVSAPRFMSSSPAQVAPPATSGEPSTSRSKAFESPFPAARRTPAKEASKRVALDVYNATLEDSPLEPPSVMKEWATRNYASLMDQSDLPLVAPSPSEGRRKGFEEEDIGFEGHDNSVEIAADMGNPASAARDSSRMLADFGGGTTAKIDDLLAGEQSFGRLVDDEDDRGAGGRHELADESYTAGHDEEGHPLHGEVGEGSYRLEEGYSEEEERLAGMVHGMSIAPPEDTLFGAGAAGSQQQQAANRSIFQGVEEDTAFGPRATGASAGRGGFRVMGAVDHTLHGGQLLER